MERRGPAERASGAATGASGAASAAGAAGPAGPTGSASPARSVGAASAEVAHAHRSPRGRSLLTLLLAVAAAAASTVPTVVGVQASRAWNARPYPVGNVHVVMQAQRNDCGPAVIATLAAWSGSALDLPTVSAAARLGPDGVSLAEFARLASLLELGGAWYRVPTHGLPALRAPFVAHLRVRPEAPGREALPVGGRSDALGHLVAVRAITSHAVVVADPAAGAYVVSLSEFSRAYSGRAFLIGGRS